MTVLDKRMDWACHRLCVAPRIIITKGWLVTMAQTSTSRFLALNFHPLRIHGLFIDIGPTGRLDCLTTRYGSINPRSFHIYTSSPFGTTKWSKHANTMDVNKCRCYVPRYASHRSDLSCDATSHRERAPNLAEKVGNCCFKSPPLANHFLRFFRAI